MIGPSMLPGLKRSAWRRFFYYDAVLHFFYIELRKKSINKGFTLFI